MPGPRRFLLLVLLGIFSPLVLADTLALPTVIGSAYDRETGHLLYVEHHFCPESRQSCMVQYRDSYGELIAQKKLDYSLNPYAPKLTLTDYRRDYQVQVAQSGSENLVVDAGFDNYVRSIWEELDTGKPVRFPFLVAGFDKPFNMRATRVNPQACSPEELCLEIKLDSWLLGMLASPIQLSYVRESRKLLRFSGVSNLKGTNGETLVVDIHYVHGDERLLAGPFHRRSTAYAF